MKKYLLATTALLALASTPAFAQLPPPPETAIDPDKVNATISFDKDVFVFEDITKFKDVDIRVRVFVTGETAAESIVVVEQDNFNNRIQQLCDSGISGDCSVRRDPNFTDSGVTFTLHSNLAATIDNSLNNNAGITQFNQDVGNNVNQANVVSVAASFRTSAFVESNASVQQDTGGVVVQGPPGFPPLILVTSVNSQFWLKTAEINNSIIGNSGVTMANQNAGNMNNQANVLSFALGGRLTFNGNEGGTTVGSITGIGGNVLVALSEADLGQTVLGTRVDETNTVKRDVIRDSIRGNAGITTVNQSVGNFNNQATVISIGATASTLVGNSGSLTFP